MVKRLHSDALLGGRAPPLLSTPGLTETRVPEGPGAPPGFHSQRSMCGLKKQGPQKTKQNKQELSFSLQTAPGSRDARTFSAGSRHRLTPGPLVLGCRRGHHGV